MSERDQQQFLSLSLSLSPLFALSGRISAGLVRPFVHGTTTHTHTHTQPTAYHSYQSLFFCAVKLLQLLFLFLFFLNSQQGGDPDKLDGMKKKKIPLLIDIYIHIQIVFFFGGGVASRSGLAGTDLKSRDTSGPSHGRQSVKCPRGVSVSFTFYF